MWNDANTEIEPELGPQEHLLWAGRPPTGLILRGTDVVLIPFSVMWGGFAIFWEVGVITSGAPMFFWIWGIPFVCVGLYLIVGRFFFDAAKRARTFYGVTSERVIIVSGMFQRTVKSLNLTTLTDLSLTERSDRTGTISLGPQHPWGWWSAGTNWPGASAHAAPTLERIDDARRVYETIREAQQKAGKHASHG